MKVYLEPYEVAQLEEAATNLRDKLLIRLLFHLGCRVSEATALGVEDIDFARGTVTIEHLKAGLRLYCPECGARLGRSHAFCPGCGGRVEEAVAREQERRRRRTLPLDGETLDMLRDFIRRGGPVKRKGRAHIFGISRHRAWQVVRECARGAGLPDLAKGAGSNPGRRRGADQGLCGWCEWS